jgi:poly(beta-D-mannuronate) lyase
VNNKTNIVQTPRNNGLGSTFITIANNIIQGGGPAAKIVGPNNNPHWEGNIIFNTNGAGDMPEGSYKMIDPKLIRDAEGKYRLQKGSPAVDKGKGSYTSELRTASLDAGADEMSNSAVNARILNPTDVGHSASTKSKR